MRVHQAGQLSNPRLPYNLPSRSLVFFQIIPKKAKTAKNKNKRTLEQK